MSDEGLDLVFSYCRKPVLVMGAGNILFGDDGFGPAVIAELEAREDVPDYVHLLDVGSGARNILFIMVISEKVPETIILVDTVLEGQGPGKVFEIDLEDSRHPRPRLRGDRLQRGSRIITGDRSFI